MTLLASWVWLLLALLPLLFLERYLHRHLQGLLLLLVGGRAEISLILYSFLFLPGIVVHEGSHWAMANMLFVRAMRFWVWPERLPDGTLRLGFVETEKVDFLREALIGVAPLLGGSLVILFVGFSRLGAGPVAEALRAGNAGAAIAALWATFGASDFWIWLYLLFTVSNAMMPSASDRRAWPMVAGIIVVLAAGLLGAGLGQFVLQTLADTVAAGVRVVASALTITVAVDVAAVAALWAVERVVVRLTGYKVEYRQ